MKRLICVFGVFALSLALFACGSTNTTNNIFQGEQGDIRLAIQEAKFITANSAIVTWETKEKATCTIAFGTDQSRLDRSITGILPVRQETTNGPGQFEYEAFLTGLPANTPVFYRITAQAPGLADETTPINQVGGTILNPNSSTGVVLSSDSTAPARNYVVGQVNVEAARITVTNNTNESVRITRVPLVSNVNAPPLINLRLVNLANQIPLSPSTNLLAFSGNTATFDNLDIVIAAKSTLTLQPRGDISATTAAHGANFTVNLKQDDFVVVNAVTGAKITPTGSVTNGAISILSATASTGVVLSTDNTAPARTYVTGQVDIEAARITVANNTNENIRITRVPLISSISAPPLINLRLVNLANQNALSPSTNLLTFSGNTATFDNLDIIVAANTTLTLQPRGDISPTTAAHGANFTVNLDQTNLIVANAATGAKITPTGSVSNGAITVL